MARAGSDPLTAPGAGTERVRLDAQAWWAFVSARAVPGVEVCAQASVRRALRVEGRSVEGRSVEGRVVEVTVDLADGQAALHGPPGALDALRRWVGGDRSGELPSDPLLDPLVSARPLLTVPGAVDGAELALKTVLGQQVSVPAARTLAGRLASLLGDRAGDLLTFPVPAAVADAGPDVVRGIGLTGARAATVVHLARALADGLELSPTGDHGAARRALASLPGIGPWTVEYVALRALRDLDAFPAHDLVLRRMMGGLSPAQAVARAEGWRPWRGLAAQHLWTAAAAGVAAAGAAVAGAAGA